MSTNPAPETVSEFVVDGGISGKISVRRLSSPYSGAPDMVMVDSEFGIRLVLSVDEAAALTAALGRVSSLSGSRMPA